MRIVLFYQSLISDWNTGSAHFLKGIVSELSHRGHEIQIYEPIFSGNKAQDGITPLLPKVQSAFYQLNSLNLDETLDQADLVLVQEGNPEQLINLLNEHRKTNPKYRLLFHDTHHKILTDPNSILDLELQNYDGVLASGKLVSDLYSASGIVNKGWTWHEAADTQIFHPITRPLKHGDLVWVGNWGNDERSSEFYEYLIQPIRDLELHAEVFGVQFPQRVRETFQESGIHYRGWIPNHRVPEVFSRFPLTIHIPRRSYVHSIPGIPSIRIFEALACGIPLLSAPWNDSEGLFTPGLDYLIARNGMEMTKLIQALLHDPELAAEIGNQGRATVLKRHTCAHRVDELLEIFRSLKPSVDEEAATQSPNESITWASA